MTREELSQEVQSNQRIDESTTEWCERLLDKVFDDFDSRTCTNCKWYSYPESTRKDDKNYYDYKICDNKATESLIYLKQIDEPFSFGCTKFQSR